MGIIYGGAVKNGLWGWSVIINVVSNKKYTIGILMYKKYFIGILMYIKNIPLEYSCM